MKYLHYCINCCRDIFVYATISENELCLVLLHTLTSQKNHTMLILPICVLCLTFASYFKNKSQTMLFVESEVVRRLSFKAEYDVTCDLLNSNVSRAVLRSTLSHRRDQLQRFCAGSK